WLPRFSFRASLPPRGRPTAAASAIAGAAACPPCALPAAGRLGAAFARTAALRGPTADFDFLAATLWAARFRPRTADFPAALALALPSLSTAHCLYVAAMIRARPSGLGPDISSSRPREQGR